MTQGDRWTAIILALAGLLMVVAIILVFGVAPDPSNLVTPVERFSQRIFYFHVPTWWVGFLAFSVAAGSGLLYLITRHERWDVISLSSVEIGVAFTTMGLITGSIALPRRPMTECSKRTCWANSSESPAVFSTPGLG